MLCYKPVKKPWNIKAFNKRAVSISEHDISDIKGRTVINVMSQSVLLILLRRILILKTTYKNIAFLYAMTIRGFC